MPLDELVAANIGKNVIAFTHKPVLGDDPAAAENRCLIAKAVIGRGFLPPKRPLPPSGRSDCPKRSRRRNRPDHQRPGETYRRDRRAAVRRSVGLDECELTCAALHA
jgi:hypothetical protein